MSVQLEETSHRYGERTALRDVSLKINEGEQVALIGPSGCGKTTLLRLIGTQLAPSEGLLHVLGQNPAELSPRELSSLRTRIAMIPQHLGLVPNVRVLRNVLNGRLGSTSLLTTLRQMVWPNMAEKKAVFELLERTGIAEKIYDRTDSLSGGQQQRVAVARALFQKPSIILADEPVSSIDPARARSMIQLLSHLSRQEGLTLIVSLHNLELAREFFPRLIGLREGGKIFDTSPEHLSERECRELYQIDEEGYAL